MGVGGAGGNGVGENWPLLVSSSLIFSKALSEGARQRVASRVSEGSNSGFTSRALNSVEPKKLPGFKTVFRCISGLLDSLEPDLFL